MLKEVGSVRNSGLGYHEITLGGTEADIDLVRRMIAGACWLRTSRAHELETFDVFETPPPPEQDPALPPAWAFSTRDRVPKVRPEIDPVDGWHSPAFVARHLCGYNWSEANYRRQVELATAYGFQGLRSRRGRDGQFWEAWVLPFAEMAQGPLAAVLAESKAADDDWRQLTDRFVAWLCKNLAFGCLDVTVQRAAMCIE